MEAYIYARWSTLEQTKGSTLSRQIDNCTNFAAARGWDLMPPPIIDRGVSAYTGKNITVGELGKFANRILCGALAGEKSVLVVEELDRLSRQPAGVMISWLTPLLNAGLTIAVTSTEHLITRDMMSADIGSLLTLIVTAFGSHNESKKKAERVAVAWDKKRNDARAGLEIAAKHRAPKWLAKIDGRFVPITERELIVRKIFENRLAGIGKATTARQLNELALTDDNFSTWSLGKIKPKLWTATYIGRVLCNRAVLGEWQPFTHARGEKRKIQGDAIENFYPEIIDPETFARVNDSKLTARLKHQGKTRNLSNLLGNKAQCSKCLGRMTALGSARVRINQRGEARRHYFLYCETTKMRGECDHAMGWPYDLVEKPLLDTLLHIAMKDQSFQDNDMVIAECEREVITARATLEKTTAQVARLLTIIENDDTDNDATALYQRRRAEARGAREALAAAQELLATVRGKVTPAEHARRVSEVRKAMNSDDADSRYEARSVVKAAVGDLIEMIRFNDKTGHIFVSLIGITGVFVIYRDGTSTPLLEFSDATINVDDEISPPSAALIADRRAQLEAWYDDAVR
ncbi:MAG: recombinase family protein [Sphingomonadaceae bacterium]|nr:recombinase family protein [Sphingomonadaceae bacterium]